MDENKVVSETVEPTAPTVSVTPQATVTSSGGENPAKTMGVIGLILAIFLPLIGLIVSIIAKSKSKKAGFKNGPALAGIIVSIVLMLASIAVGTLLFIATFNVVKAPIDASTAFMNSLSSNNLTVAYSQTSTGFQKGYTQAEFSDAFKPAVDAGLKQTSVASSKVETVNGETTATIVYNATASDGKYKVTVELTKEGDVWKVVNVTSEKQ